MKEKSTLEVSIYQLPDGNEDRVTITEIYKEDAEFFESECLDVSMETLTTGQFVLYSSLPTEDNENDEVAEVTYIVPQGQSCPDAMAELRKMTELIIKEKNL